MLILETMARTVHAQGKFKKAAIFAEVSKSELPIDCKGFDTTLRRYCYSAGQFWNGSKYFVTSKKVIYQKIDNFKINLFETDLFY